MNAVEIEQAVSALAEQTFTPEDFPYAFLEAFGNKATTVKRLKTGNTNKSDLPQAVLQRNNIHIQVCPEGEVDAASPRYETALPPRRKKQNSSSRPMASP